MSYSPDDDGPTELGPDEETGKEVWIPPVFVFERTAELLAGPEGTFPVDEGTLEEEMASVADEPELLETEAEAGTLDNEMPGVGRVPVVTGIEPEPDAEDGGGRML